jgi:hypothetical protein
MFRRTVLTGMLVAMFASHASHAAALGALDACTWKGNFIATGAMTTARAGLVATEFGDGSVLVTGGSSRSTTMRSAEHFDRTTGTFTALPDMTTERYFHTATRLALGDVLIVGGSGGAGAHGATATAEIFDRVRKTFRATTGALAKARVFHTATLMSDGTVLIVGGVGTNSSDVAEVELFDPATGQFRVVASLSTPRSNHTAARMTGTSSTSDEVLIAGGKGPNGTTDSVEIVAYDSASKTATVRTAPPLAEARQNHSATLLQNGHVLVVGGLGIDYQPLGSVERWAGHGFVTEPPLAHPRRDHHATLLPTGQVLVAGGLDLHTVAATELYTPGSGFRDVGDLVTPRFYGGAVGLPTGQVLYVGGFDASEATVLKHAELYDPFWAGVGPMHEGRKDHSATLLQDGRVLLAGGGDSAGGTRSTAELFDPVTGTFTVVGMNEARSGHAAARLAGGAVLLAGGQVVGNRFLASAEVFDPATNAFSQMASLSEARLSHTATALADGRVIVAGGFDATTVRASTEIFTWNAGTAQGTFASGPAMTRDRIGHASVLLDNGHVLSTGGRSAAVGGITYSIEELDPAAGGFSLWPSHSSFFTNRRDHTIAVIAGQSRALVAGGLTTGLTPTNSFEVIPQGGEGRMLSPRTLHAMSPTRTSPTTFWVIGGQPAFTGAPIAAVESLDASDVSTTTAMPALGTGRARHTATLLADGRVLVAGGHRDMDAATATAEISKSTVCATPPPFGFRLRGKVTFEKTYLHIDPKRLAIRALVGNGGRRNNPAFDLRFDLVGRDGDERRIVLGRMPVPKLGPAERTRLTASLPMPARLPEGTYGIRACVVPQARLAGGECFDITGSVVRGMRLREDHFPHLPTPTK